MQRDVAMRVRLKKRCLPTFVQSDQAVSARFVAIWLLASSAIAFSQTIDSTCAWNAEAEAIYDAGFARSLMKSPGGGVGLFNHDLIQNDAPGAGRSEKGASTAAVWGSLHARKIIVLDEPRAARAELYVFPEQRNPAHPLTVFVNGHALQVAASPRKGWETVRWVQFPAGWLKKGNNIIDLSCPEAQTEDEGWRLAIARADEFEHGGGDPSQVGETSFRSSDGGKSWQMGCGADIRARAEWCVRIALERHLPSGTLETPVIDLWKAGTGGFIARQRTITKLMLAVKATTPPDTSVVYHIRKGTHPRLESPEWSPYEKIGTGPGLDAVIAGDRFNRRY
ncbi:MAG: hypothetical protein ACREF9_05130, partial [Opitutaceae bacterium]